ncbi:unnamed protein product [Didymodactylos carnosus]|nr:unnamed protein product [Didymodactylos carnosus]CAF4423111.1 unnamed protein product [Didymodactylos carnosus]
MNDKRKEKEAYLVVIVENSLNPSIIDIRPVIVWSEDMNILCEPDSFICRLENKNDTRKSIKFNELDDQWSRLHSSCMHNETKAEDCRKTEIRISQDVRYSPLEPYSRHSSNNAATVRNQQSQRNTYISDTLNRTENSNYEQQQAQRYVPPIDQSSQDTFIQPIRGRGRGRGRGVINKTHFRNT